MSFCVAGVIDLLLSTCSISFCLHCSQRCGLVSPRNLFHLGVPALSTSYLSSAIVGSYKWELLQIGFLEHSRLQLKSTGSAANHLGVGVALLSLQSTTCFCPSGNTRPAFWACIHHGIPSVFTVSCPLLQYVW